MPTILGPSGLPMLELGGERAWRTFVNRDIVASLQWLDLGSDEGAEPVLALFPANRRMETGAYVIPQRNAHAYAKRNGDPTPQLLASAFTATVQMGFYPDSSTVHRVVDTIVEAIGDLIRMPSAPEWAQTVKPTYGIEASAAINGRVVAETVL